MSDIIDRQALKNKICDCCEGKDEWCNGPCFEIMIIDSMPAIAASPWHRVEEPPLPNQDLWLHDERGYYHVGYISTYRGYTEYIDMDGNTLHGIDYWMQIEPPKEVQDGSKD